MNAISDPLFICISFNELWFFKVKKCYNREIITFKKRTGKTLKPWTVFLFFFRKDCQKRLLTQHVVLLLSNLFFRNISYMILWNWNLKTINLEKRPLKHIIVVMCLSYLGLSSRRASENVTAQFHYAFRDGAIDFVGYICVRLCHERRISKDRTGWWVAKTFLCH